MSASDRLHKPPRVVIAGAGPAAHALATALSTRGADVTIVAPDARRPTENTLCAFADLVPPAVHAERYERTLVAFDDGTVDVDRAYARLDAAALCAADVNVVADRAVSVADDDGGVVLVGDANRYAADVVVDATGAAAVLAAPPAAAARQSAYGLWVRGSDPALAPGTALFMDWRSAGVDDGAPPSFLYALAGHDGRILFEETTLASKAPVDAAILRRRLTARLQRRGARIDDVIAEEHVCFPMGSTPPVPARRAGAPVPFGAALGLVSPLSGYSVARSLGSADVVAETIVDAVASGAAADVAVINAVYDDNERQRRHLATFALQATLSFSQEDSARFFAHFFALPPTQWRGFFDGSDDPAAMRRTMLSLFADVDGGLRVRLMAGALTGSGLAVAADILGLRRRDSGAASLRRTGQASSAPVPVAVPGLTTESR